MKKNYIIPTVKLINLGSESNMLLSMSQNDDTGYVEGGMSNERDASSSIWGED